MGERSGLLIVLSLVLLTTALVSAAEFSIDISGLQAEEYNPGENMTFKIILLENGIETQQQVDYILSDALQKKEVISATTSNEETTIKIENDFPSGIWTMTAIYGESEVTRSFNVGENQDVELRIEADSLIIENNGNTRYTKTIQIKIGDTTNSYIQNIKAGDIKVLKLISADGTYNIEVTDGINTIERKDVQLFGTGNVVGAIDEELVDYTGFAGADDLRKVDDRMISLRKVPLSMIFIAAVGILAFLVIVERKLAKRKED